MGPCCAAQHGQRCAAQLLLPVMITEYSRMALQYAVTQYDTLESSQGRLCNIAGTWKQGILLEIIV